MICIGCHREERPSRTGILMSVERVQNENRGEDSDQGTEGKTDGSRSVLRVVSLTYQKMNFIQLTSSASCSSTLSKIPWHMLLTTLRYRWCSRSTPSRMSRSPTKSEEAVSAETRVRVLRFEDTKRIDLCLREFEGRFVAIAFGLRMDETAL